MKHYIIVVYFTFFSVTLSACQSLNEEITELKLIDNITEISISKSNGYGGLNESYFLKINQVDAISDFEDILENSKRINSNVDVINEKPDFDILVRNESGETNGFHLLFRNEGEGMFMYIGHEQYGYITSPKDTYKLKRTIRLQ
ncbi:hypothetical protein [Bacillus alkalicellulosilyticus]|uniref:hypothetical protein n=1 Tax=Alkalihalobacterium alkalicellulosilyticum TaxID=1912214 RepID=UPI000998B9E1|nr:hypothetical protein [Bacillus alkalicellulosilyticus]